MKKLFAYLTTALIAIAAFSFSAAADTAPENLPYITNDSVAYISYAGSDNYSGAAANAPKKNFGTIGNSGAVGLVFKGGTLVVSGKLFTQGDYVLPRLSSPLLITSAYAGTDYQKNTPETDPDCAWKMASGVTFTIQSDVILDDIIFFQQYDVPTCFVVNSGATLVIGDGVTNMALLDHRAKIIVNEGGRLIVGGGDFDIENNGGEVIENYTYDYLKVTQTAPAEIDENSSKRRETVFVAYNEGSDSNSGLSASAPKRNLLDLYSAGALSVVAGGGTLVATGRMYFGSDYTIPKLGGYLIITGEYGGVSYVNPEPADNPAGGVIKIADGCTLRVGTDARIDNIIFFQEGTRQTVLRITNGATVTVGENVICMSKTSILPRIVVDSGATLILEKEDHGFSRIIENGTVIYSENVADTTPIKVCADSATVWGGEEVTVPVTFEENYGFGNIELAVEFDSELLTLVSVDTSAAITDFTYTPTATANEEGKISFVHTGISNIAGKGGMAQLTFRAAKVDSDSVAALTVSAPADTANIYRNLSSTAVSVETESGEIGISGYLAGDVDGDNAITALDASLILQYKASWDVEINARAADVDGSGGIDVRDAALILQYLADWEVELKK